MRGEARLYGSAQPAASCDSTWSTSRRPDGHTTCVLRPSAGEAMEAVGVFDSSGSEVELELGLGAGDYAAVDISLEPDAGPPEHSGTSLAGGTFERPTT